jgi:paraquat-inducible protein B
LWLAINAWLDTGPTVSVSFSTASGIVENKTQVRLLNVEIGVVTNVQISSDLSGVVVSLQLDPIARKFLRADSEFWVVRPKVSGLNVSGLGTLLSGAYIEFSPGVEPTNRTREFVGLEKAPETELGTPGVRLELTSESSGSAVAGSPILYRGFRVGTVESTDLDLQKKLVSYSIFVDEPYDELISTNTRFFDVSGISVQLNADGVRLDVGSLKSVLEGGISFGLPMHTEHGEPITEDMVFRLYPNEASTHEDPYRHFSLYVARFDQSMRGLSPGAPVTYRGLRIGSVERIMSQELVDHAAEPDDDQSIPVLLRIEPGRLSLNDSAEGIANLERSVVGAVDGGLRATLKSGNILTGALYVSFDYDRTAKPAEIGSYLNYRTLPTTSSGLDLIEVQVSNLLAKINNLPLEQTLDSARLALDELNNTLVATRKMIGTDDMQKIGSSLNDSLGGLTTLLESYSTDSEFYSEVTQMIRDLRFTLDSIQDLSDRVGDNPNQLVFPSDPFKDPEPKVSE